MREIRDPVLLEEYLTKYHIRERFSTRELPFRLVEYAPGEIINLLRPAEAYFKFLVEGVLDLYLILPNGEKHMIHRFDHFGVLGDMEFCGKQMSNHCQEVLETVRTVELPMDYLQEHTANDPVFLRFLLDQMAFVLSFCLPVHPEFDSLRDALLYHMKHIRPDGTICSVEDTASRLNCSRRQLQRILKQLLAEKRIHRLGRGCYQLAEP